MIATTNPNPAPPTPGGAPDLLILGGTVWTGVGSATAEAIAVRDGRVLATGSLSRMRELAGPDTRVMEATDRFVMPGFIDSHVHFLAGGRSLSAVRLRDASTRDDFRRRVSEAAGKAEPGQWITGGEWDHHLWGGALPTREWIDPVSAENPVWLTRLDLHMGLANGPALALAGIADGAADVTGGEIVRDANGLPTGILKDEAMNLVTRVLPRPGPAEQDRALAAAAAHALANGVTQVHDMQGWDDLAVYRAAHSAGRLPLRVYSVVPMSTWRQMADLVADEGRGDDRLWWGGLKAFVDGSLGSATAWFHDPYLVEPHDTGLVVTDLEELRSWIDGVDKAGLQSIVHAIGDRAVDWLLDVYEVVGRSNGPRDRRFRVEHAQHLGPGAAARFAASGIVASAQPYHAIDDGRWVEAFIGQERSRRTYAFASLLEAGARLAFGSDWTVAPLSPILGMYAAVTRRTLDGANPGGWIPEQRITVSRALEGYTGTAAWAGFKNRATGVLARGAYADVVMLDQNPMTVNPVELASIRVVRTLVEGETVFEREA